MVIGSICDRSGSGLWRRSLDNMFPVLCWRTTLREKRRLFGIRDSTDQRAALWRNISSLRRLSCLWSNPLWIRHVFTSQRRRKTSVSEGDWASSFQACDTKGVVFNYPWSGHVVSTVRAREQCESGEKRFCSRRVIKCRSLDPRSQAIAIECRNYWFAMLSMVKVQCATRQWCSNVDRCTYIMRHVLYLRS